MNVSKIPSELRDKPQWVKWRIVARNGKETKVPVQSSGEFASSTNPLTWTTFQSAMASLTREDAGIGFVFSDGDPYCGIDLDACRDPGTGTIADWANPVIADFGGYAEVSPSGTGVKIFVRGTWPHDQHKVLVDAPAISDKTPAIEVYDRARYFAVTGDRLDGRVEVIEAQGALDRLHAKYFAADATKVPNEWSADAAVLDRARRYLATLPPAIEKQNGSGACFRAACILVIDFALSESDALMLLTEWNACCIPPWSDRELRHKIASAMKRPGTRGRLRDASPTNYAKIRVPEYAEGNEPSALANLICAADITPKPVEWMWPGRIAIGKPTMLAGDPKLGKSFVTVDIVARVTTGQAWPDGSPNSAPGGAVILSAEDDPEDTIVPRLIAAGADRSRIKILESVNAPDGKGGTVKRAFCLEDLPALAEAIDSVPDCKIVVIDPVSAYCGKEADGNSNTDIRCLLGPLAALASEKRVALLMVSHLRKGDGRAMYRIMGSLAFVAAARAVIAVTKCKTDSDRRLVVPVGQNIGAMESALAYSIRTTTIESCGVTIETAVVAWEPDPVEIDADEALAPARRTDGNGAVDEAKDWLSEHLTDGAQPAAELKQRAEADGIKPRTLDRAKKELGVEAFRVRYSGPWSWRLKGDQR